MLIFTLPYWISYTTKRKLYFGYEYAVDVKPKWHRQGKQTVHIVIEVCVILEPPAKILKIAQI